MAALSVRSSPLLFKLPNGLAGAMVVASPMSSEVRARPNLAAMKKGRGGRSSFSGDVVTVFGSNGFLGRGVCNRLGKNGSQMILPYRGDHYKMMRLKVCGDLGQVLFCPFELMDEDSIRRAVDKSSIVINLIGRAWETKNFSYEDINIEGPATLARVCKESGVKRFIHMSSINAREQPDVAFLPGGSKWLKTKWQGERAVMAEFPEATIFRASEIYGQADDFLAYYLSRYRQNQNRGVPLFTKGELVVKQPVWMSDVVSGIMASLHDPEAIGTTYEAIGPERLTLAEFIDYVYRVSGRTEEEWRLHRTELMTDPLSFVKAYLFDKIGLGQYSMNMGASIDKLERTSISDESEGLPNLTDLGVKLHTLEDKIPWEVAPWDYMGYYEYELGERQEVPAPKILSVGGERAILKKKSDLGPLALLPGTL